MIHTYTTELHGDGWELAVEIDMLPYTSDLPTPDPGWRYTDAQGHEHYHDDGYPTLRFVIDAQHWCDGSEGIAPHDPHMHVDEAHYECSECGEVIEPGEIPPGDVRYVPGRRDATLTVRTLRGGMEVTERLSLTEDEVERIATADRSSVAAVVAEVSASVPDDRRRLAEIASHQG